MEKFRLLSMPTRATVYLKAGITSVLIGHPGEPSVIWGNPKGIWQVDAVLGMGRVRDAASSLQASITKSLFTLCSLYLSV